MPDEQADGKMHAYFWNGVGKMMHMIRWLHPEIQNAVREVTRQAISPNRVHVKAMNRVMEHCIATPSRGWLLKPTRMWNGKDKTFKFRIVDMANSDYAKCPVTHRSVSGCATFLEGAPITVKSVMQKVVALSVTDAKTINGVQCAQDMLYCKHVLEGMGLQVE
eukprot:11702810-Ditylum_brightwellii.AAC.1